MEPLSFPAYAGIVIIMPGEVAAYARKSVASEGAGKSIDDQIEVCVELADEVGLPLSQAEDIFRERPGFGGDSWWQGGGGNGLLEVGGRQFRPEMTKIMQGICAGTKKAIVVWSSDRLFRDVGMAKAFVDVMVAKKALLFDRSGYIPLETPDQRAAFYNAIVAAQHYREMCQVNSPRGIKKSLKKGINCSDANTLGFRGGPRNSKLVHHVPEEQAVVRRIFRLYLKGLSTSKIAALLMSEGFLWTPELAERRGKRRNEHTASVIYDWQVARVLTDPRYQGRQRQYKQEWDCAAYLIDGTTPVVDVATFQAAQDKIDREKKHSNATRKDRAFTGLLRCGLCGQGMQCQTHMGENGPDGKRREVGCWRATKVEPWCWCNHKHPNLREEVLDRYADAVLGPLLVAELHDRALLGEQNAVLDERATVTQKLREAENYYMNVLPTFDEITPTMLRLKEQATLKKIEELKTRLRGLESQVQSWDAVVPALETLSQAYPTARRDALHSVLRWAAIFAGPDDREPLPGNKSMTRPVTDAGYIVFLTAWGTYHTAKVYRDFVPNIRQRQLLLRPATLSETVEGVCAFPEPASFLKGLERAWQGGKYGFNPSEVAPGYTPGMEPQIAEFEANFSDVVDQIEPLGHVSSTER